MSVSVLPQEGDLPREEALAIAKAALERECGVPSETLDAEYRLDMELCLRLGRRGHACVYTPYALLRCHAALPSLANASEQDQIRCYDALRDTLLWGDPHCSPNYDFQQTAPLVASAPRPAIEHNGRYCN